MLLFILNTICLSQSLEKETAIPQILFITAYKYFLKELSKKKVKLSLSEEAEWQEYFEAEKTKALEIKHQIDQTDKEIDQMVYALYELTPEEIEIVEGS